MEGRNIEEKEPDFFGVSAEEGGGAWRLSANKQERMEREASVLDLRR